MKIKKYTNDSLEITEKLNILRKNIEKESQERINDRYKKFLFSIEEDEKFLGGCYGIIVRKNLHIRLLWINTGYRKNKYGTRLIKFAEKLALKEGCTFITLHTIYNKVADNFYKNLGYFLEFSKIDGNSQDIYENFYRKNL